MGLFDQIFKTTTTLDQIKKGFDFLIKDFGFKLLTAEKVDNFRADNFLVYRNEKTNIQIEICADESWFHSVVRRIVNGDTADYNDKENCISFEDLARYESDNNYDHFDYFAGGQIGLKGVIENTAKLFKRNRELLTSNLWLETDKIQNLKDQDFKMKFGVIPDKNKPTFFSTIKELSKQYLQDLEYEVTLDSSLTSPFDNNSVTDKLIFEKGNSKIEISQQDWRDFYFIYQVFKNDYKIFEIDLSKIDRDSAVDLTLKRIKSNV